MSPFQPKDDSCPTAKRDRMERESTLIWELLLLGTLVFQEGDFLDLSSLRLVHSYRAS